MPLHHLLWVRTILYAVHMTHEHIVNIDGMTSGRCHLEQWLTSQRGNLHLVKALLQPEGIAWKSQ